MKTTDYIINTIDRLPKGYVFTYEDFMDTVNKKEAIIKALNRMVASGKITKQLKGKYYKPEQTVFGDLQPHQYDRFSINKPKCTGATSCASRYLNLSFNIFVIFKLPIFGFSQLIVAYVCKICNLKKKFI